MFTCHLQRYRVLLVVDAHHHFAAVQTRVAGTESRQSQASIVSILVVPWQRHAPLEGLFHLQKEMKENVEKIL